MKTLSDPKSKETLQVYVSGKVQGVGFRAATVRQAHQLGLGGWVRNLEDGRVQALIQGPHARIDEMLSWFMHGPATARVRSVEHEEVLSERKYDHFQQL